MGTLYLVSTPIGNMQDLTFRAAKVLKIVQIIACEDTRKTGLLLKFLDGLCEGGTRSSSDIRLISYFEGNETKRIPEILELLEKGQDVALVSSAGTPTISDPGFKLVRECLLKGVKVEAIPGPSALLTALVSSGFPTDKFLFLGFLPKKQVKRQKLIGHLTSLKQIMPMTVIIYLSPHRLLKELQDLKNVFGDIDVAICRELTKIHEEIRREKIGQSISHFEKEKPKGEFTLVF